MPKKTSKKTAKKTVKKTAKKTEQVVVMPQIDWPPPATVMTEAQKIWNEIKDRSIQMFGLPDQVVSQHCSPVPVEPSKLYVLIRSTATLPSLETAIADKFTVELADKWVIITRLPPKQK